MQLMIKNNLTIIQTVDLKGHSSTGLIELVDIQKDYINL
jgi:hypothetical protein